MLLRQLNIFLCVCRKGSMTAAAEELYMTQPAVSQTIRELEDHYGTRLFDRFPRRLQLTDSGQQLQKTAEAILTKVDEMEVVMRESENEAPVRIGANLSVGNALLRGYIEKFRRIHPDSEVRTICTGGSLLEEKLLENELDFLLMEEPTHEHDYILEPFYLDKIVIVTRPGDPLLEMEKLLLKNIKEQPFLLREKGAGVREQFDHICLSQGIRIYPHWESSSNTVLVNAVLAGEGIAVLPYLMVRDRLERGELKELHVDDVNLSRTLYVIRHPAKYLARAAQDFIAIILGDAAANPPCLPAGKTPQS